MKILSRIFVLVVALAIVSCSNDGDVFNPTTNREAEVQFALSADATRTMIGEDGRTTNWVVGDKIALWAQKNSGEFVAEGAQFMLHHFSTEYSKAFFAGNIAEQTDDSYTYYMCSPMPGKVDGTSVTYTLPAEQDGTYNGAYDIMVARATEAGAITASGQTELNTSFIHQMHALKIMVPEKESNFDSKIYKLEITFPNAVVGDITFDVTNPNGEPTYSNTSNTIVVESAEGIAVGSDIWVFVLPGTVSGDGNYKMTGLEQRSEVQPCSFDNREFVRGHVTPIKMSMPPFEKYTALTFSIGNNYLGEDFNFFTLYDNNNNEIGVFNRNAENRYIVEHYGELDAANYNNKTWKLVFDSDNAVVENSVNLGTIRPYFQQNIAPVDVPYLLFQDFEDVSEAESYGNNSYSSSEREQPGVALSGTLAGWNAARFWLKPGAMRINSRYQSVKIVMSFASYHHGRLDTPTLGNGSRGIKAGKSVSVKIDFDVTRYNHTSSSLTINECKINIATHTKASNPIDGIPTGSTGISSSYDTTLADFGTTYFSEVLNSSAGNNAFGESFPTMSTELPAISADTRICFYPTLSTKSGTGNAEVHVYIDNIKVSIAK